ncbi:MAG TPA: LPS assembly lipoprotein LptE [Gammaproteobacteria bacterium]|nr:LPS assembly lipoprotein LptE [Gammaproteobacteria bacterium]
MRNGPASLRRWITATLPVFLLLGGCGFHLVGTVRHLPPAMAHTCIQSGEPYGHLENLLRNAIRAHGDQVTETCTRGSAVLAIIGHSVKRRVLAVNAQGHPLEYAIYYQVSFRLDDKQGKTLLPETTLKLQRQSAYSIYTQLGSGRRQDTLVADMQREASQLILLRLQAVDQISPKPAKN